MALYLESNYIIRDVGHIQIIHISAVILQKLKDHFSLWSFSACLTLVPFSCEVGATGDSA